MSTTDLPAPKVWNKRARNVPKDAVYVGRPTKWGNPFSHLPGTLAKYRVQSRQEAIDRYIEWINETDEGDEIAKAAKRELRGKHLVCWCAPQACHADVLLEIANAN